jgi:LPXTG-motif cell wall-anchored protein
MVVLDQVPKPSPLRFEVPDVAPGVYLVVMYDGSEGGRHYTWNEFEVTDESRAVAPAGRRRGEESHIRWLLALGIVILGAGAGWLLAIRRQDES